ncbi:dihydroorotase [Sphingorhabdus lutea]|uniref:Dihydroorotase n=1 Tax=Sphingorhabdus lutea TaxID=1913578 RepID=A0A1L3JCF0_9SPHN|nr:amidohydrolase family protein [Sphingorhabdus lutea]APG62804.1 dihydroorotase [Sphingorhabdus lutea]
MNKIIKNIALFDGRTKQDILISDQNIADINKNLAKSDAGKGLSDADIIDGSGLTALPAIIDIGTFKIDKAAFFMGGIARAALMPDQNPTLDEPSAVKYAALKAKPDLWIHPIGAATKGLENQSMAEYALMKDAGARAISTGRHWISNSGLMLKIQQYAASLDLPLIIHAEDCGLTHGANATSSLNATILGILAAPPQAESIAIARDIALAEISGAALHFRHVTTAKSLDLIKQAKKQGLKITAGVSPAYLLLNDMAISDFRTFAHLSPPLRSEDDRLAALEALADGTIDILCSAHDPRDVEEKRLPFSDSAAGMVGAQSLLSHGLNLVRDGVINMERLTQLLSSNPAKLLGLGNAGKLENGFEADIILVDEDAPWQIKSDNLPGLAGNTPFDGLPVIGKVRHMLKGGKLLF